MRRRRLMWFFFFQAEDGIRDIGVTGVQTCALPIWPQSRGRLPYLHVARTPCRRLRRPRPGRERRGRRRLLIRAGPGSGLEGPPWWPDLGRLSARRVRGPLVSSRAPRRWRPAASRRQRGRTVNVARVPPPPAPAATPAPAP